MSYETTKAFYTDLIIAQSQQAQSNQANDHQLLAEIARLRQRLLTCQATLNGYLAAHNMHVNALHQRDKQITTLTNMVVERDVQLGALLAEIEQMKRGELLY